MAKPPPSVTVLITVKNSRDTIQECVESVLKLDYPHYKIFITDAFSTDGTYEILEELQEKYPTRIRLEQVRGNIAKAHNYMIERVKTPFIAMTDADCVADNKWLDNLISGFDSGEIIASAGYCSTPRTVNKLQKLIGLELESRFNHFPEFISRAPTMNLCVRTEFAQKVKFNEKLDVAQETEWGYRLTELGKMRYVPSAIVYHYHRPKLKNFFVQQFKYGEHMPIIYLKKYKKRITGDHISTTSIFLQLFLFDLTILFLFLSIFFRILFLLSIFLIVLTLLFFLTDALRITKSPENVAGLFLIYIFRAIAWTLGLIMGLLKLT